MGFPLKRHEERSRHTGITRRHVGPLPPKQEDDRNHHCPQTQTLLLLLIPRQLDRRLPRVPSKPAVPYLGTDNRLHT